MSKMIATCHVRHIFMPINQNFKKIYAQCNNLLNQNNSIPQTVFAKNNQNENSLIVENKFNPISSGPCVHFGTKLKVLIAFSIENKQQDDSVHLFTIIKRNNYRCLSIVIFFSHKEIRYWITTQSILTLNVLKQ